MHPEEPAGYRFGDFVVDVRNRRLHLRNRRLELNARYFDALVLLLRHHGQLVTKDQFFEEVWQDVVVTDAALTQGIRAIRKQLDDDASAPQFIRTVPGHGYVFIAEVEPVHEKEAAPVTRPVAPLEPEPLTSSEAPPLARALRWPCRVAPAAYRVLGGMLGGAAAGVFGGLLYGTAIAGAQAEPQAGAASILLVLISLNVVVGLLGAAGITTGTTLAACLTRGRAAWTVLGGTLGGAGIGGMTKLLGIDAFRLFFGRSPAGITGAMEGAVLGALLATALWLGGGLTRRLAPARAVGAVALAGLLAGLLVPLMGGHLMGGSLELLAQSFGESRVNLGNLARLLGEVHFGTSAQVLFGGLEGLLFGVGVGLGWTIAGAAADAEAP